MKTLLFTGLFLLIAINRLKGVVFHQLYLEQLLKPKLTKTPWEKIKELPASFLWDNCDYYREIANLVQSYTLK